MAPFCRPAAAFALLLPGAALLASCCRQSGAAPTPPQVDVIRTAREVAVTRFTGFTYGSRQDRKQIDCVQFTGAVTEALLGRPLTRPETDALYIRYSFADLDAAVAGEDPRTRGIQRALTEVIPCATAIPASGVRPGDFVQYWIRGKTGKWAGHSAVVTRVFTDAAGPSAIAIYSSNKSTNGIAEMDFDGQGLSLRKPDRKFYFVRMNPSPP